VSMFSLRLARGVMLLYLLLLMRVSLSMRWSVFYGTDNVVVPRIISILLSGGVMIFLRPLGSLRFISNTLRPLLMSTGHLGLEVMCSDCKWTSHISK
jgi:hypothetical protein